MNTVIMILQFLAGLSLLVFFHELGHFLAAKAFGIRVKKYYLFFDTFGWRIFHFHYKGTEFGLGWLPIGGYVRMAGTVAPDEEEPDEDADVPQSQRYHNKPAWQRLIVMSSGILMNLFLALVIYCGMFLYYGRNQITAFEHGFTIMPGKLGLEAGLQPGDEVNAINADSSLYEDELLSTHLMHGNTILSITRNKGKERVHMHVAVSPKIMQMVADRGLTQFFAVSAGYKVDSFYTNLDLRKNAAFKSAHIIALNGDSVRSYNDFIIRLKETKQRQLYLTVIHDGKTSTMLAHRDKDGHIGFSLDSKMVPYIPEKVNIGRSISAGSSKVWSTIAENTKGLQQMVKGEVKVKDGLLGPVRIASLFSGNFDGKRFWSLVALLSTGLGLINLLPLAPFDGGIMAVLVWESVTRKKAGRNFWAGFYLSGLLFLVLLTCYVLYNDIRAIT